MSDAAPVAPASSRQSIEWVPLVITDSSGNEPWVFRVDGPEDLIGAHRDLMGSALNGERARCVLYSPAWQGRGQHFGIDAAPASHALAVTDQRFVITRDAHDGSRETFLSIPFDEVALIEKGSALLLAWLVVRYVRDGALQSYTVLHKSTGGHHFDGAIQEWRKTLPIAELPSAGVDDHWKSIPRFLYYEIEPVLLADEQIYASLHASEHWVERRRLFGTRSVFVQPWSSAIVADRSLIAGVAEQPVEPRIFAFGANVTIIPHNRIASAAISEREIGGFVRRVLQVHVARSGAGMAVDLAFDEARDVGEAIIEMIRR